MTGAAAGRRLWHTWLEVTKSLSVEEVRTLDAFEALECEWNDLVKRTESPHFSSTFEFTFTWWQRRDQFRHGNRLFVLLFREADRLIGIAPFTISEVRLGVVRASKVSFIIPDWLEADFIAEPSHLRECVSSAINYIFKKTRCYQIDLLGIPDGSVSLSVLRGMALRYSREYHSAGCYLPIRTTWNAFLESKSRSFRKAIRYFDKELSSKGKLETVRARERYDSAEILEKIETVDKNSWKAQEKNWGVLSDLIVKCNERGWLDVFFEELNGIPIAYLYLVRYGGKAYVMTTSYNLDYASDSPGLVLFAHAFQVLFEEHELKEIDFLSTYDYLRRWSDLMRNRYMLTLYRGGLSGQAFKISRTILNRKTHTT